MSLESPRNAYEQLLQDLLVERQRPVPRPPPVAAAMSREPMDDVTRARVVAEFWGSDDRTRAERQLVADNKRRQAKRGRARVLTDEQIEAIG